MTPLLLSATAFELEQVVAGLDQPLRPSVAGRQWTRGILGRRTVQVVETGIGAVNTAHALTRCLQMELPPWVLQFGVGGAYESAGLDLGDLAVATTESFGDLGVVTPAGWRSAEEIGIPVAEVDGESRYNRYPLAADLTRAAAAALEERMEARVALGPFVTVQACSGTAALGRERASRAPGALCESMEGAAAAQLCWIYGVPLVEVRAISNRVEDRDTSGWDLPLASRRAQEAARILVEALPS